jgi:phospholipid/cholesterol/gamma-HCH transport system substrate-binding protein
MSERSQQIQVGIVFILSLVVLIAGVLWFKDFKVGGASYEVTAVFPSTSGLIKGDPVEVQGVASGKVEEISYEEGIARVTLRLNENVKLYPGTQAAIENVGIMGQKLVSLYPGPPSGDPLPPGTVLEGSYQPGIPQLMAGLGGTLLTFERFATRLDSLLALFDENQQGQLRSTLANTERMTLQLADLLEDNRRELASAIRDMSGTMAELDVALKGRGEKLGTLVDNAASASAQLDTTLATLDQAVKRMDGFMTLLESPDGTVGKALNDDQLYDDLVTTLEEARALLADVRENPRRYFKMSIF